MRNNDTAIGSTKATTFVGCCSRVRALSIIAGNEASEDCVLAATICAGRMPAANRRKRSLPNTATVGYSSNVTVTYIEHCSAMYQPKALITAEPVLAQTASTSANTPS